MLTRIQIDAALPFLADGVRRYRQLQVSLHVPGFCAEPSFRKAYCHFYGLTPHRNAQWQEHYFTLLVAATHTQIPFTATLHELRAQTGRVEA